MFDCLAPVNFYKLDKTRSRTREGVVCEFNKEVKSISRLVPNKGTKEG